MVSAKTIGAGAFVVLGVLLFAGVLFMIGERRMLFEDRFAVEAEFSTLGQLEPGSIVRVAGLIAGGVTGIQPPDSPVRRFRVKMEVRKDLRPLIRTDSVATIRTEGLVGGTYVNIAPGTELAPVVAEGGTIPSREPLAFADLLQQTSDTIMAVNDTVQRLSGHMEKTVEQVALTTGDARALLTNIAPRIQEVAENGARISTDTQQIIATVRSGEGTIGKLIGDDSLYRSVRQIVEESSTAMANVRQATDEARQAIADIRSDDGPAGGLVADMRMTLSQAREATADLADNMEALKHNFFLRGFFNRRGYFDLDAISPAEYRKGVLENGKRKAMRIWLSSGVIFQARPDGTEVLTADGRARLDSAMASFLRHLPSNPLVVEGYAAGETAGDRYRLSRRRAEIVREYVLDRYRLTPRHTGLIGLGGKAEGSPAGDSWDGVAVTLFLDFRAIQFAAQERAAGVRQTPDNRATQ